MTARVYTRGRLVDPVGPQVADGEARHRGGDRVADLGGNAAHDHAGGLGRHAVRLAQHDVRRRSDRHAYAPGAALDQVDRDLGAGVARAHDQHVAVGYGLALR